MGALSLRRRGISVLLDHHAGRNGEQRGTSKREDVLDTMLTLRHPADYLTSDFGICVRFYPIRSGQPVPHLCVDLSPLVDARISTEIHEELQTDQSSLDYERDVIGRCAVG